MAEESPNENIQRIGVAYVEAIGNLNIHYVFGVVNFYESESLNVYLDSYDEETNTVVYKYDYAEPPLETAGIKSYVLPVFYPVIAEDGESYIIPDKVLVVNANDSTKKKSTSVVTSKPVVLPALPGNGNSGERTDLGASFGKDIPRVEPFINSVVQPDGSSKDYYVLFVIAKTDQTHLKGLSYSESMTTIACAYQTQPSPPSEPENIAAVGLIPSSIDQFNLVTLADNSAAVSYDNPHPFYYNA